MATIWLTPAQQFQLGSRQHPCLQLIDCEVKQSQEWELTDEHPRWQGMRLLALSQILSQGVAKFLVGLGSD